MPALRSISLQGSVSTPAPAMHSPILWHAPRPVLIRNIEVVALQLKHFGGECQGKAKCRKSRTAPHLKGLGLGYTVDIRLCRWGTTRRSKHYSEFLLLAACKERREEEHAGHGPGAIDGPWMSVLSSQDDYYVLRYVCSSPLSDELGHSDAAQRQVRHATCRWLRSWKGSCAKVHGGSLRLQ